MRWSHCRVLIGVFFFWASGRGSFALNTSLLYDFNDFASNISFSVASGDNQPGTIDISSAQLAPSPLDFNRTSLLLNYHLSDVVQDLGWASMRWRAAFEAPKNWYNISSNQCVTDISIMLYSNVSVHIELWLYEGPVAVGNAVNSYPMRAIPPQEITNLTFHLPNDIRYWGTYFDEILDQKPCPPGSDEFCWIHGQQITGWWWCLFYTGNEDSLGYGGVWVDNVTLTWGECETPQQQSPLIVPIATLNSNTSGLPSFSNNGYDPLFDGFENVTEIYDVYYDPYSLLPSVDDDVDHWHVFIPPNIQTMGVLNISVVREACGEGRGCLGLSWDVSGIFISTFWFQFAELSLDGALTQTRDFSHYYGLSLDILIVHFEIIPVVQVCIGDIEGSQLCTSVNPFGVSWQRVFIPFGAANATSNSVNMSAIVQIVISVSGAPNPYGMLVDSFRLWKVPYQILYFLLTLTSSNTTFDSTTISQLCTSISSLTSLNESDVTLQLSQSLNQTTATLNLTAKVSVLSVSSFNATLASLVSPSSSLLPGIYLVAFEEVFPANATNSTISPFLSSSLSSPSPSHVGLIVGLIFGLLAFFFVLLGVVLILLKRRRDRLQGEAFLAALKRGSRLSTVSVKHSELEMKAEPNLKEIQGDGSADIDSWNVLGNIELRESLGFGNFGEVFFGIWDETTEVAVKMLRGDNLHDFHHELAVLQGLNHPNIVRLLGVHITAKGGQGLVMEYMSKGNLVNVLISEKAHMTLEDLFWMASDAAAGMSYLEEKKIVHRDLSLRNLLACRGDKPGKKYCVKVSDFGLSRSVENGYYRTKDVEIPVRWCAPEVFQQGVSTAKSDVWAFGVVLWEMFSYGLIPYAGLTNMEVAQQLPQGLRLTSPVDCPLEVYTVMLMCWRLEPSDRPTFKQLNDEILSLQRLYSTQPTAPDPSSGRAESKNYQYENEAQPQIYMVPEPEKDTYEVTGPARDENYEMSTKVKAEENYAAPST